MRLLNINSKLENFFPSKGYSWNQYFSDKEVKLTILRTLPRYALLVVYNSDKNE